MKSNAIMSSNNIVATSGEFNYVRKPRILKAYGEEFPLPVKTTALCDKIDEVRGEISECKLSSETYRAVKKGIALFIGTEKTEKLFPDAGIPEADPDELLGFWQALNFELNRTQREIISQYTKR